MHARLLLSTLGTGIVSASCFGIPNPGVDSSAADLTAPTERPLFELNLGALPDESGTTAGGDDDWHFDFKTWIWLLGVDGDLGARGLTMDVSADFGDILDASDSLFAFSGRLEIGKGKWGGFIDGMYAKIGVDDVGGPSGSTSIDINYEETLIDFGLTYRIGEWDPAGEAAKNVLNTTLDLYAGARYTNIRLKLNPEHSPAQAQSQHWFDPIFGAKLILPLAERWHIRVNGDIGGFGVESDFAWSATAVFGYDFTLFDHPASIFFGYRAIGQDYTDGNGSDRFTWDIVQHGPLLGFSLLF